MGETVLLWGREPFPTHATRESGWRGGTLHAPNKNDPGQGRPGGAQGNRHTVGREERSVPLQIPLWGPKPQHPFIVILSILSNYMVGFSGEGVV